MGRSDQAQLLTEQGLTMARKLHGEASSDTAFDEDALGLVYLAAGEPAKARPLAEAALKTRLATSPPSPFLLSQSYDQLGLIDLAQGSLKSATQRIEQALDMRRNAYRTENDWVAISFDHLGRVLLASGDLQRSQQAYENALRISRTNFQAKPHPITCEALYGLGMVRLAEHNLTAAASYLNEARQMQATLYPPVHPALVDTTTALDHVSKLQTMKP
jgi:tetratricopeptide (TPR) repeat protein